MGIFDFFRSKKRDEQIIIEVPEHLKEKKEELPASKRFWKGTQIVGIEKLENEVSVDGYGDSSDNLISGAADNSVWGSGEVNNNDELEIDKPSREDKKKWKAEAKKEGKSSGLFNMFG